jgi:hypothetical protein
MYLSIIKPIKHATIETPNIKSTTKMNNRKLNLYKKWINIINTKNTMNQQNPKLYQMLMFI